MSEDPTHAASNIKNGAQSELDRIARICAARTEGAGMEPLETQRERRP